MEDADSKYHDEPEYEVFYNESISEFRSKYFVRHLHH